MIAEHAACRHCGAKFNSTSPVAIGLAVMLVIAALYVLSQRYW